MKIQSQLIEDLLDVSRMIHSNLKLNLLPINLATVINAAIDVVSPAADVKKISIESKLDSTIGKISGDFNRLQQIVVNLLSNAIKFTPKNGRVEVTLSMAMADENTDSSMINYAQITVSDTGKGISQEFLPYVFERFRQADKTTTRRKDGLGLGLAIVRHLVEAHGGNVTADSQGEGKGATFTVRLPLEKRE